MSGLGYASCNRYIRNNQPAIGHLMRLWQASSHHVGFSASRGGSTEIHDVQCWSFSSFGAPGSDLAGETAAAMASASMAF